MKKNNKKKSKTIKKIDKTLEKKNFSFNILEVVFIVVISIFFGIVVGFTLTYKRSPVSGEKLSKELQEFIAVYDNIKENYYDEVSDKKLLDAALDGMLSTLNDPNSVYMDDAATEEFNINVQGTYTGIGAGVQSVEGEHKVVEVYENSPAKKAGLKEEDIIIKVDGKDVTSLDSMGLANLVRGKNNTTVKITVLRNGKEKAISIKRQKVELDQVSSKIIEESNKKIGYLFIESFSSNIYKQIKEELTSLEKKNIDCLIIDLRENPGGYLAQAKKFLDLFFDKKTVLYQIDVKGKKTKYYATDNEKRTYPVVLLGNNSTASAAEVVISCFQDNYKKATYVGEITYGKGTVQKSINLPTGETVKYTTQKWLTSKGKWIDGEGLTPDVHVLLNKEYYDNPSDENDKQLKAAIEVLTK